MAEGTWQVVFRGESAGEQPLDTVKQQLAATFGMTAERVEPLFSGKPVVVKKNVDETTARKFEAAIHKAGALCDVHDTAANQTASAPAASETSAGSAESPPPASAEPAAVTATTESATAAAGDPHETQRNLSIPDSFEGLSVDATEEPLGDNEPAAAPSIDTSELDLAEPQSGRLSDPEQPPPADIDTSGLTLESNDPYSP